MHTAVVSTPALYLEQLGQSWARHASDGSLVLSGSRGTGKSFATTIAAVRRDLAALHDLAQGEVPANQTSITVAATAPAWDISKSVDLDFTTLTNTFSGFGCIDNFLVVDSHEPCAQQISLIDHAMAAAQYRMPIDGGSRLAAFTRMHEILHSAAETPLTWYFRILANQVYAGLLISASSTSWTLHNT